jgi:hypothetical protein
MESGQLDKTMSECHRALELNPAGGMDIEIEFVRILAQQRRYDEACSAVAKMPTGKVSRSRACFAVSDARFAGGSGRRAQATGRAAPRNH